jgi:hypothetical protein
MRAKPSTMALTGMHVTMFATALALLLVGARALRDGHDAAHALREGPRPPAFTAAPSAPSGGEQDLQPASQAAAGPPQQRRPPPELHCALERVAASAMRAAPDPSVKIAVDRSKMKRSGQWFEVSWSGVDAPDYGDWVALLPAGAEPLWSAAPIKYQLAAKAKTHVRGGSGKLRRGARGPRSGGRGGGGGRRLGGRGGRRARRAPQVLWRCGRRRALRPNERVLGCDLPSLVVVFYRLPQDLANDARRPAHRFRLINYRQDLRFGFMRGGFMAPRLVAATEARPARARRRLSEPLRTAAARGPPCRACAARGSAEQQLTRQGRPATCLPPLCHPLSNRPPAPPLYDGPKPRCQVIRVENPNEPLQGRLALTGNGPT